MIRDIIRQIDYLLRILIQTNFSVSHNGTAEKSGFITWSGFKDIAFALKNQPYEDIYYECIKERAFNFMLIDGAIVQLMYSCHNNKLIRHRLAFFPNPNIERFQDNPEEYEELYLNSELFSDVIEKKVIAFPLRIDFDSDATKYLEYDHSFCHMTIGNYKNCRIPVTKPISPIKFMHFILKSFYFNKYVEHFNVGSFPCELEFDDLLTEGEHSILHIGH